MNPLLGKTLSHYRIIEKIGQGGMGVVYRGRDTRLERDVAVKVLSAGVLADETERTRFRREVLLLSQLSHPNIATVYDFDTQGDWIFLVMEYIVGLTLSDRLQLGPMPRKETIEIGAKIAEALVAAHESGVVHRDLKPSNVIMTPRGLVKLLDFGLARKYVSEPSDGPSTSTVSTRTGMTNAGQVMGTPGYMSPEQIRAERVDVRADIFSFGCVLYECLAGTRAFPGKAVSKVLLGALTREPSWSTLPRQTPKYIRDLLKRCLQKEKERRYSAMREVLAALTRARRPSPHPSQTSGSHLQGFPQHGSSFIGRGRDLSECKRMLRKTGLLTLSGPGGVGKTRLAIRLAQSLVVEHPGGVWFVDLAPLVEGSRVAQVLASVLGVRDERRKRLVESLIARLRGRGGLIVLDNCEHVLEASADLAARIHRDCPQVRIVTTSRERLGIPDETVYQVPPLSVPRRTGRQSADSVAPHEAVRLFSDRAALVRSDFVVTDQNASGVAEICRNLEGIPLAIEIAAARMKALSVEEIRARLDDQFRLLTTASRFAPSRHQSLRATIQWSYELLPAEERSLFRHLGVFARGWDLEAVTKVCARTGEDFRILDLLTRLIDKSLVMVERSGDQMTRYRFLDTVRQFAVDALEKAGESEAIRRRHFAYFLSTAQKAEEKLTGSEQAEWLERLETDHENIIAAIEWSSKTPDLQEAALDMAGAIWRFWYSRGYFGLGRKILEKVIARRGSAAACPSRGRALRGLGVLAYYQGDYRSSGVHLQESLGICTSLGDKVGMARAINALGGIALDTAEYDEASDLYHRSLAISRELGDRGGQAVALGNLAAIAKYRGDDAAARPLYEQSLALMREIGDRGNTANLLFDIGALLTRIGETEAACERFTECLGLIRVLQEKRSGAYALEGTCDLLAKLGHKEDAARLCGAAAALRQLIEAPLTPNESGEHDTRLERIRGDLGDEQFGLEWGRGSAMSFETAIDHGLDSLARLGNRSERRQGRTVTRSRLMESTAHLLAKAQLGDLGATDRLARRYLPLLKRWAHGRLPPQARGALDTDDIVQVTLVRAFDHIGSFEPRREGAFLAYLRQILLNQLRDAARRAVRSPTTGLSDSNLIDRAPSPLEALASKRTFLHYDHALRELNEVQREGVILRVELGYSNRQIADALGVPSADAARMLVHRGLIRLAGLMKSSLPSGSRQVSRRTPQSSLRSR